LPFPQASPLKLGKCSGALTAFEQRPPLAAFQGGRRGGSQSHGRAGQRQCVGPLRRQSRSSAIRKAGMEGGIALAGGRANESRSRRCSASTNVVVLPNVVRWPPDDKGPLHGRLSVYTFVKVTSARCWTTCHRFANDERRCQDAPLMRKEVPHDETRAPVAQVGLHAAGDSTSLGERRARQS
jgi:hypothetical protein